MSNEVDGLDGPIDRAAKDEERRENRKIVEENAEGWADVESAIPAVLDENEMRKALAEKSVKRNDLSFDASKVLKAMSEEERLVRDVLDEYAEDGMGSSKKFDWPIGKEDFEHLASQAMKVKNISIKNVLDRKNRLDIINDMLLEAKGFGFVEPFANGSISVAREEMDELNKSIDEFNKEPFYNRYGSYKRYSDYKDLIEKRSSKGLLIREMEYRDDILVLKKATKDDEAFLKNAIKRLSDMVDERRMLYHHNAQIEASNERARHNQMVLNQRLAIAQQANQASPGQDQVQPPKKRGVDISM